MKRSDAQPAPGTLPDLNGLHADVLDAEWSRLMRSPSLEALGEDMAPSIQRAREWATEHVKPYCAARWSGISQIRPGAIQLTDGTSIQTGEEYTRKLERFNVDSLIIMGFTLGDASHQQAKALWDDERFEESYMLSTYSAALAESLRLRYTQQLSAWAREKQWSLLTPEGPGYNDWSTDYLPNLYETLAATSSNMEQYIKVTPDGVLAPVHSMLLVLGIHHNQSDEIARLHEVNPCSRCSLAGCAVRRVPFDRRGPVRRSNDIRIN